MHILVCVKQVPYAQNIAIDPVTNTLVREGVESILNPFDGYALEAAARLKDANPAIEIHALSMGPPQAEAALRECLAMAADKGYLATDRAFAGSDTLATSYILSETIRYIEREQGISFALIFCGKQAIDGDTAQVGPQIAELLGMAQVTNGLVCELQDNKLFIWRETDEGKEQVAVELPCLATFTKPGFEPRLATVRRRTAARRAEISVIGAQELQESDFNRMGLKGSPTQVKRTFAPTLKAGGVVVDTAQDPAAVAHLAQLLVERHIISTVK
ncbi:MAG: electron transfer flavoprotein subunit beta/FixA family protein [Symbiobacteriaceae bacterium]|nr:electron transfer flavoprotein subunit beta/FixA family protein [Symbiobacteriaceae bacterium]